MQQSYVIIGNGIAGATAAEVLRTEDSATEITVVTDEPTPVFYRPALKDYLGGKIREEKLWARPISFYPERRIRFVTDRVVGILPAEHTLQLQGGQRMAYSRLLLAHGARATSLTCPGVHLQGVTTLRTVADYQRVLARLNMVRRIVVVGSGTLALESIETLRHRGYEVTHLLRRRTLWSEVLDPVASDLILQQEKRDGVDVRTEQEIAEVLGQNGQVVGVVTTGGQHISCEVVLLGIGIEPILDFVKSAGIACGRGVKVDGGMRTNVPDVYAAGDLVETTDPITRKSRVIGQWYPSIQQARAAAYSMLDLLDTEHTFNFGNFYNATFLYGLDFASVGISSIPKGGKGYQEIVADPRPRHYQKTILKDGVPVGMLALGDRRSVLAFKRAIDHGVNLSSVASRLFAPDFSLGVWLDQQGVPAAILGVNREGAVAVEKVAAVAKEKTPSAPAVGNSPTLLEAKLIPTRDVELTPPPPETYISQTRVLTIGRQAGCGLLINHHSISRRHAEISYVNGQYILRDLGSKNGTGVNGTRIESNSITVLKANDQLRFGSVSFSFQLQAVAPASSILLNKQQKQAFFAAASAEVPAIKQSADASHEEVGDQTMLVRPSAVSAVVQGQPVLYSDDSLVFPGASSPLSPAAFATLRKGPALVAILKGQPQIFPISTNRPFSIGRDPTNTIVLPDMSVSRRHAELFAGPDGIYICDLHSGNGIQVNHNSITTAYRLAHEEHLSLGNVSIYYMNYQEQRVQDQRSGMAPRVESNNRQVLPGPTAHVAAVVETKTVNCRQCGLQLEGQIHFCPRCGAAR